MYEINYNPIGIIHTPFNTLDYIPIQNIGAERIKGTIEIFPEFEEGLKDLAGFSHIILIYHLHKITQHKLIVTPFMDTQEHGIFATRSPVRPNPIGLTTVKLFEINKNQILFENPDMLNGTPLLDIKPCLPMIDNIQDLKIGWLTGKIQDFKTKKSDNRFI